MTSRPGPGILDSLQSRGSGGAPRTQVRRPPGGSSLPQPDCIDPSLEDERPSVHNGMTDAARPPPRGRPPLFFTTTPSSGAEPPMQPCPYQPATNLPVPPRPGSVHLGDASQQHRILPGGTGVKDVPALQPPEALPPPVQFPGGKAADVFPWTGNSAEDTLSEALIKGGVSNKPQIMNETNTARPSLWSNLKNKSGLTTLSTLFVAVLEKRQQSGRLHAPHTFKPPPRLTLRDSTREQWLHDLANPAIGLRRLSRTIPHGLTGKVLLEQCLNKRIPLPRALWLSKCVGINELRAHKRKGQAGTLTWVRGWTSSVEQFLDAVISSIGQGDWKPRITYSLQLATHLYKEHLLDDDHFLDWILNCLDACPNERLFVWLLVVSVSHYWIDIVSCRRRGKRLAEALLNHLDKLYRIDDQSPSSAVLLYLETTLTKLLLTRPACLLLPTTWARHGALLDTFSARTQNHRAVQAVRRLQARANRLLQSDRGVTSASLDPAGRVYRILDSVDYSVAVRIEELSNQCMEVIPDALSLLSVVLQWACSAFRGGSCRVYLATRLLRRWSHLGADVYDGVISYLCSMTWAETGEPCTVFKVVAELVRSKTFAAGRYLQWLIATGSLGNDPNLSSPSAWPLRLITEIPLNGLSDQVRTLRCTILRGTAYSAELEEQTLDYAKHAMRQKIPNLFGLGRSTMNLPEIDVKRLNPTVKLELGIWLRQQVARYAEVNEHVPTKDPSVEETAAVTLITTYDFHTIRSYLEHFEDLAILADVVNITISSLDPDVLACAADTLSFHTKAFRAIGALDTLFNRIAMRYAAIRTIRFPERQFLLSLTNLARIVPADEQLLQVLSYDLSRLDQKNSIAACSPASDNMGEVIQNTGSNSDDEIERILSSGTSMDHQMMGRVLRKIICNLEDHVAINHQQFDNHPAWLYRLRSFDEPTFDMTVNEWLISCLMSHRVEMLRLALPCLVASACMGLSSFLETLRACVARLKTGPSEGAFQVALEGLRSLLPSEDLVRGCSPQDAYRYQLEQHKLCYGADGRILQYIGDVAELASSTPSAKIHGQLSSLLASKPVLLMLKEKIISDPGCLLKLRSGRSNSEAVISYFKPPLDALLDSLGHLRLSEKSLELQILAIFGVANELSLPFCQAAIEQIFALDVALTGDSADALSAALLSAVKTAVEEDQSAGLKLLGTLDPIITDKIRQYAEREIINASAFLTNHVALQFQEPSQVSAALVQKYLTVLDLTSGKRTDTSDQLVMLGALIDRLKGVAQAFGGYGELEMRLDEANALLVSNTYAWLAALLRITVAHSSTLLRDATHQHQTALMAAVKSLVTHSALDLHPSIAEHIFDVAVLLSDCISDDVRNQIARLDNNRAMEDPRCVFILGSAAPVDGWLALTKPINAPSNPQAPPSAQTQASVASQGAPMSGSETATAQQRYMMQQQQRQQQMAQAQQVQQVQQVQQGQQFRGYPQYGQHGVQVNNKMLPAQLQKTVSQQTGLSSLQQMQQMQQMQSRSVQGSAVHGQRSTLGSAPLGTGASKLATTRHERNVRQYPFVQPRWEILAESSGNPNGNETAISLSLFGARKV